MVDHWSRVFCTAFYVLLTGQVPLVNVLVWNESQLRYPSLYVDALRVVVGLLAPGVENPKVRLSIGPIPHGPLPASRILHGAVVN